VLPRCPAAPVTPFSPSAKMSGMKADSRLAVFCLVCFAILIAGIMVEKFWDCRLTKGLTESECLFTPAPYTVP
jgi:hypothetical protein